MHLLTEVWSGMGAVLLPVAAGLLLEELTLGGLVRLLLAPWPGSEKCGVRRAKSVVHGREEFNKERGGARCSH
jgi:hypothetical protein